VLVHGCTNHKGYVVDNFEFAVQVESIMKLLLSNDVQRQLGTMRKGRIEIVIKDGIAQSISVTSMHLLENLRDSLDNS